MLINKDSPLILIVDDNPTNLSVLSETLGGAGFRFRVAMDGETALALVERNHPELILLDVQMPGIDGFETCRRLKTNPATQGIPIIFTTALADTESKTKAFALGAVDYIPKPFEPAEVLARLRVHLQLKRLTESLEAQVRDRTATLQQAQVQLVQQEKLSSLGEMVAGIGHELNNPINFIVSNIEPLQEYITVMTKILNLYQQEHPNPSLQLREAIEDLELEFVLEDITKIFNSFRLGTDRIKNISTSIRTFSRLDSETKVLADLHECLDSTLTILQHRLKGKGDRPPIEVIKSYGSLPSVLCYSGQMNQVFMNILANAIDALEEAMIQGKSRDWLPEIKITTQTTSSEEEIVIKIADNGIGIPESIKPRLFEAMFTTKSVGKGTGLGLAIAHQIVVEKHNGSLNVNSQVGEGTEFTIEIPIVENT
ncbi:MAG: hybrid sensor histidine kinase/response regulator [Okeania sp. SIO2F4]|uniref:hybrid sensor histidine kinase/response regulator n=1 Tax=Okeania sp. SIO2F4 TaxID=2607790 RepID=UPI00142B81E6|nr:hybrid sensor histidine kinase/response regulator [Okeania sp. SIO2F4]NES02353.1 hybrid sensor histidine kinase/response regulator [Okeania sp. SIO2F4]